MCFCLRLWFLICVTWTFEKRNNCMVTPDTLQPLHMTGNWSYKAKFHFLLIVSFKCDAFRQTAVYAMQNQAPEWHINTQQGIGELSEIKNRAPSYSKKNKQTKKRMHRVWIYKHSNTSWQRQRQAAEMAELQVKIKSTVGRLLIDTPWI